MTKNFDILVNKLNTFRLKYYTNQLLKGIVLTLGALLLLFTVFSVVEYFVYLSTEIRKLAFFGFIIFSVLLLVGFVMLPLLRLLKIVTPISLRSSTLLIQKHFSGIQDKLLNIIELSEYHSNQSSNDLVLASIDQKIDELKVFDFNEAVNYRNIRLMSVYFLFSLLITAGIFVVNRNIFTESTNRIIHYNQQFVKPAPFTFLLENKNLKAKKGDPFTIQLEVQGDELPQIVYINIDGNNYLMKSNSEGGFQFEMASVINPVQFYFTDLKYNSEKYNLELLPKPGINSFTTEINPPVYTTLKNQVFNNLGDLQVPLGTRVKWTFQGIDVDSLYIVLNDSVRLDGVKNDEGFQVDNSFYKSTNYNVYIQNKVTEPELALSYFVDVIPDLYPEIDVLEVQDSLNITRFFFKGIIGDDYGFSSLQFHFNINNTDSAINIQFLRALNDQEFYYSFDFSELPDPEGIISYYFSVSDNDVINHYKTTTSKSFTFQFPNKEELEEFTNEQFDNLANKLELSRKLSKEIQNDLNNLQYKNMETNLSDWEKSQMVNDIVQKQNQLEQLHEQIKQENERLNNYMNSFTDQSEEVLEKQKQIEQLLEEVFTDELKKLMEEFNKLAEDFDSKKLNELTKNMNLTFDDLQKQLDRNIEMLKKMKVEQKLQDVIDQINEMATEEEQLSEDITEKKNYEEAKEKVEEHEKALDELQEKIEDALEINKELEHPINFDEFKEDFENVDESIEKSKENLDNRNKNKSSSSTKETSEKMKNMAFSMQQMLNANSSEQNAENIQNLKQILSNLIYISFTQEDILDGLNDINAKDPRLVALNQEQNRIINQSQIVKDSLYALAMRTPQINSTVNNELLNMEMNLSKANEPVKSCFRNAGS